MSEKRAILKVLQESGSSNFVKKLTPEEAIPNIKKAISMYETVKDEMTDDCGRDKLLKIFHTPRVVSNSHYSFNIPEVKPNYKVALLNTNAIKNDLSLDIDDTLMKIFDGESLYYNENKHIFPYSMTYAGYQFGTFAGQLGDGRVVNLFELKDRSNRNQIFQLKGSGTTPYSRFGDGKALVRSSIREFIISESLYNIGIPSTRAIQLTILPGTKARRETFKYHTSAVVCRMAPSWIRIGNFDYLAWKPNLNNLVKLTDYCISELFNNGSAFQKSIDLNIFKKDFFPDTERTLKSSTGEASVLQGMTDYDYFFRHVVKLNAETVAHWQAYGFLNGVLNTDNTSILGLSMDYGPFAVMDKFLPDYTPNHDDVNKRYCFANQPTIIWWNLVQLAKSIALLLGAGEKNIHKVLQMKQFTDLTPELEQEIIERVNTLLPLIQNEYKFNFTLKYAQLMSRRLGIDLNLLDEITTTKEIERAAEITNEFCSAIVEPLLDILEITGIDYNNFFVKLQNYNGPFESKNYASSLGEMDKSYLQIFFNEQQLEKLSTYFYGNEKLSIIAAKDSGEIHKLLDTFEKVKNWTNGYMNLIGANYRELAKRNNPLFIPRTWIFDEVIDSIVENQSDNLNDPNAELDLSLLQKLYKMSSNPYDSEAWDNSLRPDKEKEWVNLEHAEKADEGKFMKQGTCSS